jgi:hypothetical protein
MSLEREPKPVYTLRVFGSCSRSHQRPRRRALAAHLLSVGLMSAFSAHAAPLLRVRASSHFAELRAVRQADDRVELEGALHDDLNQPIANALVTLPTSLAPRSCDDNPVITTDHQGKFCAHLDNSATSTRVSFTGNNLLTETSANVEIQAFEQEPIRLTVDTPLEWSRAASQHVVNLGVNSTQELLAVVNLKRRGVLLATLPRVRFTQGLAVVEVPTRELPAAGPLTIHAEAVSPGGSIIGSTELGIDVLSPIHLSLRTPEATELRSGDEFALRFDVLGDPPEVNSGWIEVQADGANLAIAPVINGESELTVALTAARQRDVQVRATFVPQFQFHIPAEPVTLSVTVLGPRQWLHIPLAILLMGLAVRTAQMWRRPSRESERTTPRPVIGVAQIIRQESESPIEGWQGRVVDAHTGVPIAGATVALLVPTLVAGAPARYAVTSVDGNFRFDKLTPLPEGSRLLVQATYHSSLEYPTPQPGLLEIALVARRRTLLAAVREWASGRLNASNPEPTPNELARFAQSEGDDKTAEWMRQVDEAVHGRDPVLSSTESHLLGRRPDGVQSSAKGR